MRLVDQGPPPPGRSTDTVLVIPGVGGHPAFHDDLITGLRQRRYRVHTAPHVDFHHEPCLSWNRHVRFWTERFADAAADAAGPPAIVGISFGAHVAHAIRLGLAPGSLHSLTLISYRHLTGPERRFLGTLARTPRLGAYLVGASLFGLSDVQAGDRQRLRLLRRELYDDHRRVRRRLTARLATLASAPELAPAGDDAVFVFGAAERTLRRRHSRRGGTAVVVPGGHGVTLRPSPELLLAVDTAIGRADEDRKGLHR